MTSAEIQITTELVGNTWSITAEVVPGGDLPREIFVYENTGTTQLGSYVGVCNLAEYQRIQVWEETAIPKFGNKYVRTDQAKISLSLNSDPDVTAQIMVSSAKRLKAEMLIAASTTKVYPI